MTANEFLERFLDSVNSLREVLGEEPVTKETLARHDIKVMRCQCGDETCPGWAMKLPERR